MDVRTTGNLFWACFKSFPFCPFVRPFVHLSVRPCACPDRQIPSGEISVIKALFIFETYPGVLLRTIKGTFEELYHQLVAILKNTFLVITPLLFIQSCSSLA